jgi:polyhydroxybutyrate depolymerase
MKKLLPCLFFVCLVIAPTSRAGLSVRHWQIDDVSRDALVYIPEQKPATSNGFPVVFAFHGHGGSMSNAARMFSIHTKWPEAVTIYMQGLNTPGRLTDPDGKVPGWQKDVGDQKDRDLKFFDAVLATIQKENPMDKKRIYSTGHSNGGAFTYLLWSARGATLAAVAPSSASASRSIVNFLKPKPVFHLGGENDPLVKFEWQQATINAVRKINHCGEGTPWHDKKGCTLYPSTNGTPVVTFIHHGKHAFQREAADLIVTFFKEF